MWKAQRSYVVQTPLHKVLLDISKMIKKKIRHQTWEHLSASESSQLICTPAWGYSFSFLLVMAVKLCPALLLIGQKGKFFLTSPISNFFLRDLE